MTRPERRYVIEKTGVGIYMVLSSKYKGSGSASTPVSSDSYCVSDGVCSCKGYTFRRSCKHTRMVDKFEVRPSVSLDSDEAEGLAERVRIQLEPFVDGKIKIDEYVKDPYGEVNCIRMHGRSAEPLGVAKTLVARVSGVKLELTLEPSA